MTGADPAEPDGASVTDTGTGAPDAASSTSSEAKAIRRMAIVHSRAELGIEAPAVTIETYLSGGLPGFSLVGLPETAVREARERVKAAIRTSGLKYPSSYRIMINLAPADLPKEGGRYDLGIALALLAASGQLPQVRLAGIEAIGELGLFGEVRPVRGAVSALLAAHAAGRAAIVPWENRDDAALLPAARIYPVRTLAEACRIVQRPQSGSRQRTRAVRSSHGDELERFSVIRGQAIAKRALAIAAAGAHNLLMVGPPGAGKTMLARALPALLPPMTDAEALEVMRVHSAAGRRWDPRSGARPFRDPHHSASAAAIIGGGRLAAPGEIALAHNGVLFLDELPEFDRRVLESLRQPLESHDVVIARARLRVRYPARFQLVAAMNPCPSGRECRPADCVCTPEQVRRYSGRLSGPLLDRIDLQVPVRPLPSATLFDAAAAEDDVATLRARIRAARERQLTRAAKANQWLSAREVPRFCVLRDDDRALLVEASDRMRLSARACHRVLRVARTIADLADRAEIETADLTEALGYRLSIAEPVAR